ncbi:HAD hydrolase family protein [Staphylococcus aureus]
MNKARGIEQVRQFLNIDRNNIIAFGDEDNDIEMIEYARHWCCYGKWFART